MRLLRRMMEIQSREGAVTDATLEGLSRELAVPLYRLEGLRSFYPVFTDTPAARPRVQVCRDIVCRMRGGADHCQRVRAGPGRCRRSASRGGLLHRSLRPGAGGPGR
ncbi:MAG: NAD(P)H-dependent oxidoreductase subunit E [Arhodomonas sp.]|nr:NAD(P)H-dependent oxidoreductase subunit E [Arhodomonas sp.]